MKGLAASVDIPIVAEGPYQSPREAVAAIEVGAYAVVVWVRDHLSSFDHGESCGCAQEAFDLSHRVSRSANLSNLVVRSSACGWLSLIRSGSSQ